MATLLKSLLWQRTSDPSLEAFTLYRRETGFELRGVVVLELDGQPADLSYTILVTPDWQTRRVSVGLRYGGAERVFELHVDPSQCWWRGGQELTQLRGLYDVDLSVTPATNTLPIRRLKPNIGESYEVTAAWVKFPELELEPLPQCYTRVDEHNYNYESGTAFADFSAKLQVDDAALVNDYLSNDLSWIRLPKTSLE